MTRSAVCGGHTFEKELYQTLTHGKSNENDEKVSVTNSIVNLLEIASRDIVLYNCSICWFSIPLLSIHRAIEAPRN